MKDPKKIGEEIGRDIGDVVARMTESAKAPDGMTLAKLTGAALRMTPEEASAFIADIKARLKRRDECPMHDFEEDSKKLGRGRYRCHGCGWEPDIGEYAAYRQGMSHAIAIKQQVLPGFDRFMGGAWRLANSSSATATGTQRAVRPTSRTARSTRAC